MSTPLNPVLYGRLKKAFGSVKISQEGIGHKHRKGIDYAGEKRLEFIVDGEFYSVCCPTCGDTKHRLAVNHMFGKIDAFGRRMTFLAVCFNEDCLRDYNNRRELLDILDGPSQMLSKVEVKEGKPLEAKEVSLPGKCKTLDLLREGHKARNYVEDRGFDPDELAKNFGVCYCKESNFFLAENRLIIPIESRGKLRGWQARYVGELDWHDKSKKHALPPKYFSCPGSNFRSTCIYNWTSMCRWTTGIVVEGPTDVWRFGAMAGCIFGNVVTPQQERDLLSVFRRRSLVLLLDPEEFSKKSTKALCSRLNESMRPNFCAIKLPEGTDPGSLERTFLREYVREQAAKKGVTVTYRRWAKK